MNINLTLHDRYSCRLPSNRRLRRLQASDNGKANQRCNRITDRQELRNRHLHRLRRSSHIRQRNEDHRRWPSRHQHHGEPEHGIGVEEVGL
jgi:hypothetical protein